MQTHRGSRMDSLPRAGNGWACPAARCPPDHRAGQEHVQGDQGLPSSSTASANMPTSVRHDDREKEKMRFEPAGCSSIAAPGIEVARLPAAHRLSTSARGSRESRRSIVPGRSPERKLFPMRPGGYPFYRSRTGGGKERDQSWGGRSGGGRESLMEWYEGGMEEG